MNLTSCMSSYCGGKLDCWERTKPHVERTCKFYTESAQPAFKLRPFLQWDNSAKHLLFHFVFFSRNLFLTFVMESYENEQFKSLHSPLRFPRSCFGALCIAYRSIYNSVTVSDTVSGVTNSVLLVTPDNTNSSAACSISMSFWGRMDFTMPF